MKPIVKKSKTISPIWTLPIVAAIICVSILYTSYQNAGITVELFLKNASGITAGKTKVMVRGIPVGTVEKISPDLQQTKVRATITLDAQVEEMLVEDTVFWVVRPQLSASSITGLDTIVSGSYINMQPGNSKKPQKLFTAAEEQPPPPANTPGLHLTLIASKIDSLQVGSGIYYKNIQIGKVEQIQLLPQGEKVELKVLIEPHYWQLVRKGSRFCNASGIEVKGSLSAVSVKIASFATLLRGGIELFTPEQLKESPLAENHATYPLYASFEAADYGIPLTLRLNSSKEIVEGVTKLMYQGLVAGVVQQLEVDTSDIGNVTAHIQLDPRLEGILREETEFWLETPKISPAGVQNVELLISGAYITFRPGNGAFKNHFNILPTAPPKLPSRPGTLLHLTSQEMNIANGAPILFKNIQIGEVVTVDIDPISTQPVADIYIYQDYFYLINENSLFWTQSGLKLDASISSGISLESGALSTILFGGITVITPKEGKTPEKNSTFPLYSSYHKALTDSSILQPEGRTIQLAAADTRSLSIGSPILFKNITIGEIKDFVLQPDSNIQINAQIYEKYRTLITDKSRFYRNSGVHVHAGLDGIDIQAGSLLSIATGGISCINLSAAPPKKVGVPWRLYDSLQDAEETKINSISIELRDTQGIRTGTHIFYKGISVGTINSVDFGNDMKNIIATAAINQQARGFFRKGTKIWAVEPQIGISGVKNIKGVVFGPELEILPGDGPLENNFLLLEKTPLAEIANADGMAIVLETTHLGSISKGSPVYYRQVQVGHVTGYRLSPTFQKVQIFVSIKNRFKSLIRMNTRFWNVSGIKVRGGLFSGVTLSTESLESIARGGIAFATPDTENLTAAAKAGQFFPLHKQPEADWLDWEPNKKFLEKEDAKQYLPSPN